MNIANSTYVALFLGIVLFGCGGSKIESEVSPQYKKDSCPLSLALTFHQVFLDAGRPVPTKVSLILEGKVQYDECLDEPRLPVPPISKVERLEGHLLKITVQHFGAYPVLPETVSFEIMDRNTCIEQPTMFAKVSKLPLEFKTEYPSGKDCAGTTSARSSIILEN